MDDNINETCEHSIDFKLALLTPVILYKCCLAIGVAGTILASALFALNGQLPASSAIMVMIYVFSMYAPAMAFSNLSSQVRVMEAGLDRYEALQKQELLVEGKKGFPAANSDITFQKVSFGYQHATVLEDVNFTAKAKSITALVGPSGGGKTTIANLIARFWDVQKGSIAIGGVDVWDMQ